MIPDDQNRVGRQPVRLRCGRRAILRPLAVADGDALGDFYAAIPTDDVRFYCPHDLTREQAARNSARADDPGNVVLVLEAADRSIAGYGWVRWQPPAATATGHFGLCVRTDWQNSGAGGILIEQVMATVRRIGPPTVSLTVQKANPRALTLYRRAGFAVEAEQMRRADPRRGLPEEPEYRMLWQRRQKEAS